MTGPRAGGPLIQGPEACAGPNLVASAVSLSSISGGHASRPLSTPGAPFQQIVWEELRKIPYGSTTTYGAIAKTLGDVALSRAVGQAMGANPIPLIIPCHRVLGADGKAGGFSSPGGVSAKMRMLALEHAASPTGQYAFGF